MRVVGGSGSTQKIIRKNASQSAARIPAGLNGNEQRERVFIKNRIARSSWYWSTIRVLAFAVLATSLFGSEVQACRGPQFEESAFFDEVPSGIDAPAIVDVTITDVSTTANNNYLVGFARIRRVIKGSIQGEDLKVLVRLNSCTRGFGAGASGIVIGTLRKDARGALELIAIPDSLDRRQRRKSQGG